MRSDQARLQAAIHEARYWAERALDHIGGMSLDAFCTDDKTIDASKSFGEAAVRAMKAGPDIASTHPGLMLLEARDARNQAIHEYEKIEADNLFLTVEEVIRPLAAATRLFLGLGPRDTK